MFIAQLDEKGQLGDATILLLTKKQREYGKLIKNN